jgi:tetratricopeptide (TPR) repeat protein
MHRVLRVVPLPGLFLLLLLVVCSAPVAAQRGTPPPNQPSPMTQPARTYSIGGTVSAAANRDRLELVKMELRATSGGIVGTIFTSSVGTFQFDNVGAGTYYLIADKAGYETVSEEVEVNTSSLYGVQIELKSTADAGTPANKGPSTTSVRDLSVPHNAHSDMEKGIALLYGKSDYQGSLKSFEKALREYPDYYEAYAQMGVAYTKLTDTANAEKSFRKSIEVSQEKYVDAYIGLAEILLKSQRFEEAEQLDRKAIEIDSNSWQALTQLARALVDLNRLPEAETNAAAAAKLKPENPTIYLVLANIHIRMQNKRALVDDLNRYLQLAPDGPFAEQARRERDEIQAPPGAAQGAPTTSSP